MKLPDLPEEKRLEITQFARHLCNMRYSQNSIRAYAEALTTFFRYLGPKSTNAITASDLEFFNYDYIIKNNYSISYQNTVVSALKLFLEQSQNSSLDTLQLERPKNQLHLPVVLSLEEIERLLNATTNIKHKCMLTLIYSCGLRVGELIHLRIVDIDSKRMVIHIHQGKGAKDRIVPLAQKALELLRTYYQHYRPKDYLFNGAASPTYSATSLRAVFKRSIKVAKIGKKCTLHTLRHSYATHLLESGVNLRYIQELLGHSSPKTTQIYTHVTAEGSRRVASPLEKINLK